MQIITIWKKLKYNIIRVIIIIIKSEVGKKVSNISVLITTHKNFSTSIKIIKINKLIWISKTEITWNTRNLFM